LSTGVHSGERFEHTTASYYPFIELGPDELNDYGDNTRLTLRKGRLSKYDIDEARESLEQIYCRIVDEIGMPINT